MLKPCLVLLQAMGIDVAEPLAGGGQDCTILDLDSVSHGIAGRLVVRRILNLGTKIPAQ